MHVPKYMSIAGYKAVNYWKTGTKNQNMPWLWNSHSEVIFLTIDYIINSVVSKLKTIHFCQLHRRECVPFYPFYEEHVSSSSESSRKSRFFLANLGIKKVLKYEYCIKINNEVSKLIPNSSHLRYCISVR